MRLRFEYYNRYSLLHSTVIYPTVLLRVLKNPPNKIFRTRHRSYVFFLIIKDKVTRRVIHGSDCKTDWRFSFLIKLCRYVSPSQCERRTNKQRIFLQSYHNISRSRIDYMTTCQVALKAILHHWVFKDILIHASIIYKNIANIKAI